MSAWRLDPLPEISTTIEGLVIDYQAACVTVIAGNDVADLPGLGTGRLQPVERRRGVLAQARLGPAVMKEYFNADLDEMEGEYRRFIDQVASSRRWVTQRGRGRDGGRGGDDGRSAVE